MAVQHVRASGVRGAVPSRVGADRARLSPGRSLPARRSRDSPRHCPSLPTARWCPREAEAEHARLRTRRRWISCGDHRDHRHDDGRRMGAINFAPMGVEWGDETIVLKPFLETTTYPQRDASRRRRCVNLTDDAMLFAQGGHLEPSVPLGCRRPWCAGRCSRPPAPGASSRWCRSTTRHPRRESRPGWCIAGPGASSSDSTARDTPCSRPRSSRPGPICSRASRSARSSPGCRSSWTRPRDRASRRRWRMLTEYVRYR